MTQMTQLTTTISAPAGSVATPAARRRRPQRMVSLRTPMPLGLLTLRHDVPEWLGHDVPDFQTTSTTDATSKVEHAPRVSETPARKGA